MANPSQKHGQLSWRDGSIGGAPGGANKEQFLRLSPGSNPIRIVTDPYQYYQHKYKFEGEKGYGHRIPCSIKHGSCVVCEKNDKPKKRWFMGVIDRKTNTYKILDINWSVLSDINTYSQDDDWGDPIEYDIDIVVNPNGGPQHYYKAVAKPKRPLSAADLALKEKADLSELERKCLPPDPAKVIERFEALQRDASNDKTAVEEDENVSFTNSDDVKFSGNKKSDDLPF